MKIGRYLFFAVLTVLLSACVKNTNKKISDEFIRVEGDNIYLPNTDSIYLSKSDIEFLRRFNEIWGIINKSYVDEIKDTDENKLNCALKTLSGGLSKCLNDPYSTYYNKIDWQIYRDHLGESYVGVGLMLTSYHNKTVIVAPLYGSPAHESGAFAAGDIIEKIDGFDVSGEDIFKVMNRIGGEAGSSVSIEVRRAGNLMNQVSLKRAKIEVNNIESRAISHDIHYIKINEFTSGSFYNFYSALQKANASENKEAAIDSEKYFIFDLRDNPGGLLMQVKLFSYLFSDNPNDIIVTLRKKGGAEFRAKEMDVIKFVEKIDSKFSIKPGFYANLKIAILVNNGTASAAEIFAALLRDWLGTLIIGVKTFGKGSVQDTYTLKNGDGLKITTAEYFVGNGKIKINKVGIIPDCWVENPMQNNHNVAIQSFSSIDLKNDEQLQTAIDILKNKNHLASCQNNKS